MALWLLALESCGAVTCPEPLSNVDGVCEEVEPLATGEPGVERCDGVDNDGDDAVDEDWPELGEACGLEAGECVAGRYVCAEGGAGVVCEGAVGPSDEVCDGKDNDCNGTPDDGPDETCDGVDNDCDGLIDEGVLSAKGEVFADHATVTAIDGGFVVTRVIADQLRVETYDTHGDRTGHHDDIERPSEATKFLESDGAGQRVLVALGQQSFHVVDVRVDADLVPIIVGTQALHDDWRQGVDWGVYEPPYHPRVLASPARFVGYRDLITFAMNPFAAGDLLGLAQEPTLAIGIPMFAVFDAAGLFVVWEQHDNVRGGVLLNDGSLGSVIDIAPGGAPGIAIGSDGPAVVYLANGALRVSELAGLTMQCAAGGFCDEAIDGGALRKPTSGPTGLAFDETSDTWFVVVGTELVVVGRGAGGAVVKQTEARDVLGEPPNRVDVAVSGGTAAVVQASERGDSVLTFLGCF
jgi:hypothetical protein